RGLHVHRSQQRERRLSEAVTEAGSSLSLSLSLSTLSRRDDCAGERIRKSKSGLTVRRHSGTQHSRSRRVAYVCLAIGHLRTAVDEVVAAATRRLDGN